MEKKDRIASIYGYAVCLISVITFLIWIWLRRLGRDQASSPSDPMRT